MAVVGALALSGCSVLPSAEAHGDGGPADAEAVAVTDGAEEAQGAFVPVIECPSAEEVLTDVPADAQAEVDRELGNLENQIAAAQARLDDEFARAQTDVEAGDEGAGEEATARFLEIADSVLGDLSGSKRPAALSRIETAIERVGEEAPDLSDLAECSLDADGADGDEDAEDQGAGDEGAEDAGDEGEGEQGDEGGDAGQGDGAVAQEIVCPDVASVLTDVPADAQDEIDRELGALEQQLDRANRRLADSVGQGGPNFVQNAILGPLGDQRAAVLNRIEIAIERVGGAAPEGLADLAECALEDAVQGENGEGDEAENEGEGDEAEDENAGHGAEGAGHGAEGQGDGAGDENAEGDQADQHMAIDCEDVAAQLGDVPAAAVSVVQEQVQILEQNVSLADQAAVDNQDRGQEWVEDNIVNVLIEQRVEIVNRIEIAVAINGGDVDPELEELAEACELTV